MDIVTRAQAYTEIVRHIKNQGGVYHDWYVGIASDALERLFRQHKVPDRNAWWIFRILQDNTTARNIEVELIKLGCDGDDGGGDSSAKQVYAYLKTKKTVP